MNNKDIAWRRKKLKSIREEILSGQLNAIRELLPDEVIHEVCWKNNYEFRKRILPPPVTVLHMISAALTAEESFQSAWQRSGHVGRSARLAEARKRLPLEVFTSLHQWVIEKIESTEQRDFKWRGHRVIGTDGSGVSMSDEPELVEAFGRQKSQHGLGRFPTAKVVFSFNLQNFIHIDQEIGPVASSESKIFSRLSKRLRPGDLLVFDRHYAGANSYWHYKNQGLDFISPAHQRLIISRLKIIERFSERDCLVEMPINNQFRREDSRLPRAVIVRMIEAEINVKGRRKSITIFTSLLDPKRYPADEVLGWSKKRWKVEELIREIKKQFGAAILRSKSVEGIAKELQARLLALNLIHWLILKASAKHKIKHDEISVVAVMRLSTAYSLKMSTAPCIRLPQLYDELLKKIAASRLYKRPNRLEPRMIKREKTHSYSFLKIPRKQWRAELDNA